MGVEPVSETSEWRKKRSAMSLSIKEKVVDAKVDDPWKEKEVEIDVAAEK